MVAGAVAQPPAPIAAQTAVPAAPSAPGSYTALRLAMKVLTDMAGRRVG